MLMICVGQFYFYNEMTGETQWENPTDGASVPVPIEQTHSCGSPLGSGPDSATSTAETATVEAEPDDMTKFREWKRQQEAAKVTKQTEEQIEKEAARKREGEREERERERQSGNLGRSACKVAK